MASQDQQINIIIKAKDQASAGIKAATGQLTALNKTLEQHAKSFAIAGAAITGALALMTKGAEEQRRTQKLLGFALSTVNVDYKELGPSIEAAIASTQKFTGVSDELQRVALSKLITQTKDFGLAMDILPVVIDAAAFSGKDITRVVNTMGPAIVGATNTLTQLGIVFDANAPPAERLAQVIERVGGAAEASVTPTAKMIADLSDMSDTIGTSLLPVLDALATKVSELAGFIADLDPEFLKWATGITAVLGGLLLLLAALPKIIAGVKLLGLTVAASFGIWTGVALAVTALATVFVDLASESKQADIDVGVLTSKVDEISTAAKSANTALGETPEKIAAVRTAVNNFEKGTADLGALFKKALGDSIPEALQSVLDASNEAVLKGSDALKNAIIAGIREQMVEVAKSGAEGKESINKALLAAQQFLLARLEDDNGEALALLKEFGELAAPLGEEINEKLVEGFRKAPEEIKAAADEAGAAAELFVEKVKAPIIAPDYQALANQIAAPLEAGIQEAIDQMNALPEATDQALSEMLVAINNLVPQISDGFGQIGSAAGAVGGLLSAGSFTDFGTSPTLIQAQISNLQSQLLGIPGAAEDTFPGQSAANKAVIQQQIALLQGLLSEAEQQQAGVGGGAGFVNQGTFNLVIPDLGSAEEVLKLLDALGEA